IQTKNREDGGGDNSRHAMETCVPICSSHIDRKKYNVKYHHRNLPNPFVSILMEFGVEPLIGIRVVPPFKSRLVHAKQLPIAAYGLTAGTYKCLHMRPNVELMLRLLHEMNRNPVRGLSNDRELASTVRHCLPLQCHPAHEHLQTKPQALDGHQAPE